MKRLFGGSCIGLLVILTMGGAAALFVFSIFFNQTQAVTSNATATIVARATTTPAPKLPTFTPRPVTSTNPPQSGDGVTVQIDTDITSTVQPVGEDALTSTVAPSATFFPTSMPTSVNDGTPTYEPRHSGTSTYPLTVTAEVMLAQTNVASYQAEVAATRTAITSESETILATLTAQAPVTLTAQAVTP